jgi:hypothetical protein
MEIQEDCLCSHCYSYAVKESQRKGWVEQVLFRLILARPYHCLTCKRRFYWFALAWHFRPLEDEGDR